ncbi:hypothetical protein TIFTF001_030310 [Ficus carica]|uniref:Uncharacterized protein n=1 Tax=Ficus carica TaxID=3494 RepID=A0AA88DXE4_FICCA|nr:hypothetical protein TIFTF001_030310 [Ficus carica]
MDWRSCAEAMKGGSGIPPRVKFPHLDFLTVRKVGSLQVVAPAPRSHREDSIPQDISTFEDELARQKSAHKALVSKFGEKLTLEVAGSSKCSDPVVAFSDCAEMLIEGLCLALSRSAAARGYANRMADEVKAAEDEAWNVRQVEKDTKAARDAAREAQKKAEEALRKAKIDLASARAEHDRYVKVALPAALEEARAQAVEDFLQSEDFNSRLVAEYQKGMRDMKAGFIAANPSLVGVDWSFVLAESEETAAEEVPEEGEVFGAAHAPEDVVVLDDPEEPATPEQPVAPEQPTSEQLGFSLPDHAILFRALPSPLVGLGEFNLKLTQLQPWSGVQGQVLCPAQTPPFGQFLVVGPYSVVREPQELGGLQKQILSWVLLRHFQFWSVSGRRTLVRGPRTTGVGLILGPARALPILVGARSWDLTPWSENHKSWGVCKGRSYLGSCSGTSNSGRCPVVGP